MKEVTLDDIDKIKKELEKEESEYQRLQGRLEAAMDDLKKLGYSSITKAEKALKSLEEEVLLKNDELAELLDEFRTRYPSLFQGK